MQDQVGVFVPRRSVRYVRDVDSHRSYLFFSEGHGQPELREALISSGLDDSGLLHAYPRTPVEDLRDDVDTTAVVAVPEYGIAGMGISPRRASRWILVTMCLC